MTNSTSTVPMFCPTSPSQTLFLNHGSSCETALHIPHKVPECVFGNTTLIQMTKRVLAVIGYLELLKYAHIDCGV